MIFTFVTVITIIHRPGGTRINHSDDILPVVGTDGRRQALAADCRKRRSGGGYAFPPLFTTEATLALARETGIKKTEMGSATELATRYFTGRTDQLTPAGGEEFLVATT